MTPLVSFQEFDLCRDRQRVLQDVSLQVRCGEKVALVGPSGAGKSSLLTEIYRRLRDGAALCPQQLGLVDALSVYHNIYMARLEQHAFAVNFLNLFVPLPRARREIGALAREFGLESLLFRAVGTLSGGERQRVALARACYRRKPVFLGDEPVSSLDPEQGRGLLSAVCDRHETVVVALHSPALALENFDRVVGLRGGALVFDREAASLSPAVLADFYRGG